LAIHPGRTQDPTLRRRSNLNKWNRSNGNRSNSKRSNSRNSPGRSKNIMHKPIWSNRTKERRKKAKGQERDKAVHQDIGQKD
jgi:hypothetical protein